MKEEGEARLTGQRAPDGPQGLQAADQETERLLAARAKNGDDQAFLELMGLARSTLLRVAFAYLLSEDAALEAIQETTCRAYAKLPGLKQPVFFKTWLIRILMNVCADEQKRRKRQRPVEKVPEPAAFASEPGDSMKFEEAIADLDPKWKRVIILKYAEDMTLSDIAKLLERPEGTVKTWLNRALAQLRRELGEEGTLDGEGAARFLGAD
ncbi:sigma-70 family RNA polymerase sigma factor [Cohnella sp. GCM10012308]|uniref:sigma-70 family RNA polymerase sigma factor n=1 Tax=Cohnella sp. GCM10012308 TaxID=3317329 RepID=UPI00361923CB